MTGFLTCRGGINDIAFDAKANHFSIQKKINPKPPLRSKAISTD